MRRIERIDRSEETQQANDGVILLEPYREPWQRDATTPARVVPRNCRVPDHASGKLLMESLDEILPILWRFCVGLDEAREPLSFFRGLVSRVLIVDA
jgi:hypothetical protein